MRKSSEQLADAMFPIMNIIVKHVAPHFVRTKTRGFECKSEIPTGDSSLYEVEIKVKKVV